MRCVLFLCLVMIAVSSFAEVVGKINEDVCAIADPILDNILEGMRTDDYEKYTRDFNEAMKKALPKGKFLATNRQIKKLFGNYKSRKYLCFLNKQGMTVVLWKGAFDKTDV